MIEHMASLAAVMGGGGTHKDPPQSGPLHVFPASISNFLTQNIISCRSIVVHLPIPQRRGKAGREKL